MGQIQQPWLHPLLAHPQDDVVLLKIVDLLAVDMRLHFEPANGLFLREDMGAAALLKIFELLAVGRLLHFEPANGLYLREDMGAVAHLKIYDLLAVDLLLRVRADLRPLLCEPRKYFALLTPRLPNNFAALSTACSRAARSVKPPVDTGGAPEQVKKAH